MGNPGEARNEHATCGVRPGRAARRRGDDDARPVPIADVVLYHAPGCHLCERARATLDELRSELGFELREVDISGDDELERRYRELLPVVEIDGAQSFVYYVPPDAFRRRIGGGRTKSVSK